MSQNEDKVGDTPQSSGMYLWNLWCTCWGGLMLIAIVASLAMMGADIAAGEDPFEEEDRTTTVAGEGTFEGADIVKDVSVSPTGTLRVNLSETPSDAGISKVYLYEKGGDEALDQKDLAPLQTSVELREMELGEDYRLVAVDGSNNAVYDGIIFYKEVEYGPF